MHLNASRQLRGINKNKSASVWCFGKQNKTQKHFCAFKWKWHHALTATLTRLCTPPAIDMWDNLLNSSLGRCLICFFCLRCPKNKETGTRATKWLQQPIAAAWQLSYPRCISCPFLCLSTLSPPAEPHAKDWKTPHKRTHVVSQWVNDQMCRVSMYFLFIVNLWYFKHVGKCSVAYNCKVIEVFVIWDLTTALCYYNSAWKWNKASRFWVCVEALRSADLRGSTVLLLLLLLFYFYNRFQYSSNPLFVTDLTARFCPSSSRAARLCRPGRCQGTQSRIYWFVCNVSTGLWKYSKHWVFAINLFFF